MSIMNWLKDLFNKKKRIFLDYASATPVLPEVGQAMVKYFSREFYNSSAIYEEGLRVRKEVGVCRTRIARILGIQSKEVIFTASGTESVNLAILGSFEESKKVFKRPHIIVSAIEHSSVLAAGEEVVRRGGEMSILPVDEEGVISMEALKKLLKRTTFMVSVGLANSEIGTIQPISKVGRLLREVRRIREDFTYPILHTDATAAPNYLNIQLESLQCDLLTLDASKIYGPKGVGLLAVRRGVKVRPIVVGGSQEGGRRAGTLNPALIAGFATALELVTKEREGEARRLEYLRRHLVETVIKNLPQAEINGSKESHLPNIVSVSLPGTLSEFIALKLDHEGVMVSVGTACSLDEMESGSPVIRALGKPELSQATIRFSFGRFTTEKEVKQALEIFCKVASEMVK